MSLHDYREAQEINSKDYGFYGLLMAVMYKADTENTEKLKEGWPEIYDELYRRYHSPGGFLDDEHLT